MKFKSRSSSIASILGGTDGLTEVQTRDLNTLIAKEKLTEKQNETMQELIAKRDGPLKLSQGTKSAVESFVKQHVYEYTPNQISNKQTRKGTDNEEVGIEFYNRVFFTNHKKLTEDDDDFELTDEFSTGHPDITCHIDKKVIDIKLSYTKDTFPVTVEEAYNSQYVWQVKDYLRKMIVKTGDQSWRNGEVAFILVSTPEEEVPEWEEPSLHYVDHLDDSLRYTIVPIVLSDEDIKHIESRSKAAQLYADEYYKVLTNKNK
jgi:hypothetical protein